MMSSSEIRHKTGTVEFWLREIAAQLADLNEGVRLLVPKPSAPRPEEPQPCEAEEESEWTPEQAQAEQERHRAAMAVPVSDPEQFTRCAICEKEVPRPASFAVGESTICNDCIPF